jgi:hypothetical protein
MPERQAGLQLKSEGNMHTYKAGDHVKVEFSDESTGIGEWMRVPVSRCEEQTHQLVFSVLKREPLNDCDPRIGLRTEQAVTPWQLRPASSSCRDSLRTPKEDGPPVSAWPVRRFRAARG